MPLSEHEQRLLDEMERSLSRSDGDVVANMGARHGRPAYRSIVLGILLAVVGIAALVVGVFVQVPVVGIVGFLVMLGGVLIAVTPRKRGAEGRPAEEERRRPDATAPGQGFMDKLNARWDKRQDGR